jgi:hypothetical protein
VDELKQGSDKRSIVGSGSGGLNFDEYPAVELNPGECSEPAQRGKRQDLIESGASLG